MDRSIDMSSFKIQYGGKTEEFAEPVAALDVIKKFDRKASKKALAVKVNGEDSDLNRVIEPNGLVTVEPILPDTRDGLEVLRHSTAHLLAAAVLDLYPGTKLGIGPALLDDPRYGFFYDIIAPEPLSEDDLPKIEKRMQQMAKQNLKYRREMVEKVKSWMFSRTERSRLSAN